MTEFRLTEDHLTLIRSLSINDHGRGDDPLCHPPEIDGKRPLGYSDYIEGVCRALGIPWSGAEEPSDETCDRARRLLRELPWALQVVVLSAGVTPIQVGVYRRRIDWDGRSWELVGV